MDVPPDVSAVTCTRPLDPAEPMAHAAGCSRIHWLTQETNADAMRLHDRLADRSVLIQYRKPFVPL